LWFVRLKSHVGQTALRSADRSQKDAAKPEPAQPAMETSNISGLERSATGRANASRATGWRREAPGAHPEKGSAPGGASLLSGLSSARRMSSRATREWLL